MSPNADQVSAEVGVNSIYHAEMEHTGFSPGDSGASRMAPTSSGSFRVAEPKRKARREEEELAPSPSLNAAPATTAEWSRVLQDKALADDDAHERSPSKQSAASSSESERERQTLEKEHQTKKLELKAQRAKRLATFCLSRGWMSRPSPISIITASPVFFKRSKVNVSASRSTAH